MIYLFVITWISQLIESINPRDHAESLFGLLETGIWAVWICGWLEHGCQRDGGDR